MEASEETVGSGKAEPLTDIEDISDPAQKWLQRYFSNNLNVRFRNSSHISTVGVAQTLFRSEGSATNHRGHLVDMNGRYYRSFPQEVL